jgi:hypothetical protein
MVGLLPQGRNPQLFNPRFAPAFKKNLSLPALSGLFRLIGERTEEPSRDGREGCF